jgi:hypothetical protein
MAMARVVANKKYLLLFVVQAIGSISLLVQCFPIYSMLLDDPGKPQQFDPVMLTAVAVSIVLVQTAYWYRVFNIILPVRTTHVVYGHLVLFVSRLGFIMASALFSVIVFRHLPEIDFVQNWMTLLWRGGLLLAMLFSLYCFTTELERLGTALRGQ